VVSVAVNVHEDPTLIDIPVKVATFDPFVVWLVVPVVNGHVEATLMLSPDAAAVTVKLKVVPACAVAVPPNVSGASADAGDTATNARPASIRADVAPMATNDFIRVPKERWPTLRFAEFIIGFPPLHFPSGLNAQYTCLSGTTSSIGRGREIHLAVVLQFPVNSLRKSGPMVVLLMTRTFEPPVVEESSFLEQLLKC
jgi:hypothetical protein